MTTPKTDAQQLAAICKDLFGEEWAAPAARATGVNERTMQRIRTAAREGREYPGARGALAGLHDALTAILARLEPWAR